VEAAGCDACGFTFEGREARHFYAPSRCPRCRSERIRDPRISIP
jgi:predicted Zn-ribbon and HTH transcriptional regulator